jgi:hypothetical protein
MHVCSHYSVRHYQYVTCLAGDADSRGLRAWQPVWDITMHLDLDRKQQWGRCGKHNSDMFVYNPDQAYQRLKPSVLLIQCTHVLKSTGAEHTSSVWYIFLW